MNLKDYLKIFRRRFFWFIGAFAVIFGLFLAYFIVTQKPTYTAKTRVLIETPPQMNLVSQLPQRTITTATTAATWQSLITSRQVRERAKAILKEKGFDPAWVDTVSTTPETGTNLVLIEGRGGSRTEAVEVANAIAQAAQDYSKVKANEYQEEVKKKVAELLEGEEKARTEVERDIDTLLAGTGRQPRAKLEQLREDLNRVNALDRKRRNLELRLADLQKKRAITEHVNQNAVPTDDFGSRLIDANPKVLAVAEELRELHRQKRVKEAKYTPEHEEMKRIREEILAKQEELAQARREAAGRDLDAEELAILSDLQITEIERKTILDEHGAELPAKVEGLNDDVRKLEDLEKRRTEVAGRISELDRLNKTITAFSNEAGYVSPVDKAEESAATGVPTGLQRYWPMGLILAIVLGAAAAYLREMVDTALRTDYDVKRHLNLPVVTDIPEVGRNEIMIQTAAEGSFMAEKFDTLATILQSGEAPPKTILVASSVPKEGKTTVSVDLAVALARQGKRTLLIDGDMRVPSVHNIFGLSNSIGFSDLLLGTVAFDPADQNLLRETMPNLTVCTSGSRPENPYALLDPTRIQVVIEAAKQNYDLIVLDSPPILRTGDALKMAALADTTLLVIEAGRTDMREATWAKRLLENVNAKVAGVLLNKAGGAREQYYYYYSYRPSTPRAT